MKTIEEIKKALESRSILGLSKMEIESHLKLRDGRKFKYVGISNSYEDTIILEIDCGQLVYIFKNKIMDGPIKENDLDDLILIEQPSQPIVTVTDNTSALEEQARLCVLDRIFNDETPYNWKEFINADREPSTWQTCLSYDCYEFSVLKATAIAMVNEYMYVYKKMNEIDTTSTNYYAEKKYNTTLLHEKGISSELVSILGEQHKLNNKDFYFLQNYFEDEDCSKIELVIQCHFDTIELRDNLINLVESDLIDEVNLLIEIIDESKEDNIDTLSLYGL